MQELNQFENKEYAPGGWLKRVTWYLVSIIFFESKLFIGYPLKRILLRLYGARIGRKVKIKPSVIIKYPWFLEIGDYTWIGENVWIDNLNQVKIGANVCVSQGAMFLTGNHDYRKATFDLMTGEISIGDTCWVGAKVLLCPGVNVAYGCVLTVGVIIKRDILEPNMVVSNECSLVYKKRLPKIPF